MTTKYEILVLRNDGTNETYPVDTLPVPPETGDDWALPDSPYTIVDLDNVVRIEVGPPLICAQTAGTTYVWSMAFEGGGETQTWWCEGGAGQAPPQPGSGRWWSLRGSRGDCDVCNRKAHLYISLFNMISVTPGGLATTCA